MNSDPITGKIRELIKVKGLQYSTFADKIGVSRGTVSHILSDRNKPCRDTIEKILKAFPDISPSWLERSEGSMYNSERIMMKPIFPKEPDLFDENQPLESNEESQENKYPLENGDKVWENKSKTVGIKSINQLNIPSKKIDNIVFFFSDKTYKIYTPEE